jgi:hypothetical protein
MSPQAAPQTGEKQCNGHKRSFLSLADTRVREDIITPRAKASRTEKFGGVSLTEYGELLAKSII